VVLTARLSDAEMARLYTAARDTLAQWIARLRRDTGDRFPAGVTAFREGMAVHGRYGRPCPDCGGPIQRIVFADTETNYCPACQTGGRLLADRALSRLLRRDWPRTLAELEARQRQAGVRASPEPAGSRAPAPWHRPPPRRGGSRGGPSSGPSAPTETPARRAQ
jgi:formamidopyrimidine-DNA glycosylase